MAKSSYVLGVFVGLSGIAACGGVAAIDRPDGKGPARNVEASGGAPASGSEAGRGGFSETQDGMLSSAGSSMNVGGAWHSNGGSPSAGGAASSSSGAESSSSGAAGAADEPQLSDCMPTDLRECGFCSEANERAITGSLELKTQSQVDALRGVVEITGTVKLQGDISLRSLHGLCCLQKIGGSLVLQGMYNLGNVDGLSSLSQVGGDLSVTGSNCGNLSLKGLGSLKSVGGDFKVERDECYLLERIGSENIAGQIIRTTSEVCSM